VKLLDGPAVDLLGVMTHEFSWWPQILTAREGSWSAGLDAALVESMYQPRATKQFRKDLRRYANDFERLLKTTAVMHRLLAGESLPAHYRPHAASETGNDILAQSGQQWWPALTIGLANFSLQ
jgi:hypothetical protein